jgi:hypothetical protein
VPGAPHLADQLILSQPGGEDYVHHITTGFSDPPTALGLCNAEHVGERLLPLGPLDLNLQSGLSMISKNNFQETSLVILSSIFKVYLVIILKALVK